MDRGTDPMEAEHLASTSATNNTNNGTSNTSTSSTSNTSSSTSTVIQNANLSSISMPGPSGISRQTNNNTRPTKRPNNTNIHSSKSDSSTVYQSDSSSSSDSDESPLPKRRISLVPNSNLFRKESPKVTESTSTSNATNINPNEKLDKRKKLFLNRSSNFHLTRSSSSQSIPNRNDIRISDRNSSERHSPTTTGFRALPMQRSNRTLHLEPFGTNSETPSNKRTIATDDRHISTTSDAIRTGRPTRSLQQNSLENSDQMNESELSRLRGNQWFQKLMLVPSGVKFENNLHCLKISAK